MFDSCLFYRILTCHVKIVHWCNIVSSHFNTVKCRQIQNPILILSTFECIVNKIYIISLTVRFTGVLMYQSIYFENALRNNSWEQLNVLIQVLQPYSHSLLSTRQKEEQLLKWLFWKDLIKISYCRILYILAIDKVNSCIPLVNEAKWNSWHK